MTTLGLVGICFDEVVEPDADPVHSEHKSVHRSVKTKAIAGTTL